MCGWTLKKHICFKIIQMFNLALLILDVSIDLTVKQNDDKLLTIQKDDFFDFSIARFLLLARFLGTSKGTWLSGL